MFPMAKKYIDKISCVRELIFWSYANLAMAHAAVSNNATTYTRTSYIIRNRLYSGLMNGTMNIGPLLDDERVKIEYSDVCAYCGKSADISIDHMIPKIKHGSNSADNLIRACKHCNSSKGSKDLMEWHIQKNLFPSILMLRRYIKLVYNYCNDNNILDLTIDETRSLDLPFRIDLIPIDYPTPDKLKLYAIPVED